MKMLTVKEAAELIGIKTNAVYKALNAKKLFGDPDLKARGVTMITKSEALRYKKTRWGRRKRRLT